MVLSAFMLCSHPHHPSPDIFPFCKLELCTYEMLTPHVLSPQPLATTILLSVSMHLTLSASLNRIIQYLPYFTQHNCYWVQVCVPNVQWGQTNQNQPWSKERFISRPSKKTSGSGPQNPELLKRLEMYLNPHQSEARTCVRLIISCSLLGVKHLICLLCAIWGVLLM